VLFILPSDSYRIGDFMDAARGIGVETLVATEGHQTLAAEMGDRLIRIDLRDSRASANRIVEAASTRSIDAIVPVDDQGVLVAALAGEALGLTHNPPAAVAATRNKAALRSELAGLVEQPAFVVAKGGDDPIPLARQVGYPLVAKPVGLSASVGVMRVDEERALQGALDSIRSILAIERCDPDDPILFEEFIDGEEVSIDGLVQDGEWRTLAIFDKPDPMPGPHFAETIFVTPSRHDAQVIAQIESTAAHAVRGLGLRTGAVHAEMRVQGTRVVLLELAARTIGGLCSRALRFGLDATPVEQLIIRNALGENVRSTRRESGASGVAMLPVPSAGRLRAISGLEAATAIPAVQAIELTGRPGDQVVPLPFAGTYLGFVFARAHGPLEVEKALRAAIAEIRIDVE
jgi:biotin carboxylase